MLQTQTQTQVETPEKSDCQHLGNYATSSKRDINETIDKGLPFEGIPENSLAAQIKHAIAKGTGGALIHFEDLPDPWRINSYIRSGYHFNTSIWQCCVGVFRLSNESFNVWSHILGLVCARLFALRLSESDISHSVLDKAIIASYLFAATICFGCSVFWHTMKSIAYPDLLRSCASVDLMGVSVMISVTGVLTQYAAFYCNPVLQSIYIGFTTICTISCLVAVWQPILRNPEFAWIRVTLFVLLGVTGLIPFIHLAWMQNLEWATAFYRPLVLRMVVPIFTGAMVYGSKFPESIWPGRFDFLGSSHNLWHIAVLITVYGGYIAMGEILEMVLNEARYGCGFVP
ncbi:hemolysin-III related-domain-containing protein [Xylogone sp. PMI_703]|nr:hemolysin-III related-domain-containing protein [Xylogone sp. PMI_703]